jgi:hypothetical protein
VSRQHATPLLLGEVPGSAVALTPVGFSAGVDSIDEAAIQRLVQDHPSCLPINEIDPLFCNPVPICMELNTPAGPIDNFLVTASGLPVLVECKLWRNPEGRREVVGQILDYAKEMSRWSSSDLQREVSRRLNMSGNPLLELVRGAGHEVDEVQFNDALTLNLRRGRFLLLIVGDGIREGVEAISEYLQRHANLHFAFGLVEMPLYRLPDGRSIVVPRILARTELIRREVVAVPEGYTIAGEEAGHDSQASVDPELVERLSFLKELLSGLTLSDPEQPRPNPTPKGYLFLYMPAPSSSCWINVAVRRDEVGLWIAANKGSLGDKALARLAEDWPDIGPLLGGNAELRTWHNDRSRYWIAEFLEARPFVGGEERHRAASWLQDRINTWVSVLRPRVRAAVSDFQQQQEG